MKFSILSQTLFALAASSAAIDSSPVAVQPRATVTEEQLADFRYHAQYPSGAYCNTKKSAGTLITCSGGCPDLERNNATVLAGFEGLLSGIGGYVAVDPVRREVVLAIRGTDNIRNYLTDFNIPFKGIELQGGDFKVHSGFLLAWNEIASEARAAVDAAVAQYPDYRFVITGHSLGAGVATIGAWLLREGGYKGTDLYTYGSPRVGDEGFATYVPAQAGSEYRITHWNDITPSIPFGFLGYRNTDKEYWLSTGPDTKLDYTAAEVRVCDGINSYACSGSVFPSLDLTSHRYILTDMYACGGLAYLTRSA